MQINYPEHLREHAHTIPARPAGTNMVVTFRRKDWPADRPSLFYEIIREDALDGFVLLGTLSPGDHRDPFWTSPRDLTEVPGAWVDEQGYIRIPSNATGN